MPRQEHGQVTTRSADRRQAILVAAYELFIAEGFDRTSISAIVAKVGGSKGTIYAYFGSKEKLFVDCMFAVPDYALDRMRESLDANDSLTSQLRSFGEAFLRVACAPDVVAVRRLMISEAERGGIGRLYFERFQSFQDDVASFIATYMARGNLRDADPQVAATQLRLLLEAEVVDPLLLCATDGPIVEEDIRHLSERAVDTFLRAYAPPTAGTPTPVS